MRVLVDPRRCQLHGDCVMTAPRVFEIQDGEATVILRTAEPPETLRAAVEKAVRDCPTRALRIES